MAVTIDVWCDLQQTAVHKRMLTQRICSAFLSVVGRPQHATAVALDAEMANQALPTHPFFLPTHSSVLTHLRCLCWRSLLRVPRRVSVSFVDGHIYVPCLQKTSRTGLLGYSTVRWAQQSVFTTGRCTAAQRNNGAVSPQTADKSSTKQADRASRR